MKLKRVLGCVAFVLIACVMLLVLCDMFELPNSSNFDKRYTTFKRLEDNTVDAVFIGTSGVDRYWMAPKAYEEYGMTLYALATDGMPAWLFTEVLDDIFASQNPKLVLLDVRAFTQGTSSQEMMDTRARRVLDSMNLFSSARFDAALKTMRVMHEQFDEPRVDLSYLFSVAKYHDKWMDDDFSVKNNIGERESEYMGFYMASNTSVTKEPQTVIPHNFDVTEPLEKLAEESLYEVLEYLKEKDVKVLFIDTPQIKDETEMTRANTLYKLLDELGEDYLHFLSEDQTAGPLHTIDLDYENDFYNDGHVNYYGAEKFTTYLAKYIDANYDLPDRRGDETVNKEWDGKYDAIKEKIKDFEEKNSKKQK